MSINQNDQADVAAQVAVIGEIYGKADCVSVLLPESDKDAYETIAELLHMAVTLLSRKRLFDYKPYDSDPEDPQLQERSTIASRFFDLVKKFQSNLGEYTYWTRAWTFQEWARAYDVEVTLDTAASNDTGGTTPSILRKAKSTIVYAASMIADYKLRKGQYAEMDLGWSREFAKPNLDRVKRLFPFENVFTSPDEISVDEFRFQTVLPNEGTETVLGLRASPEQVRTDEDQFKARLSGLNRLLA
ncbi:hypothetical protein B0H63DRAFT_529515 [Podospora didyma]|uniref:Heterokaryon incompatibility domain-containing protein n=1 Tax=Podospora didyma TaxID=330526 RepID=A0AAE0K0I8_9PEZI|nr:hypothetical protein B0H63DRAFT_529515 [Podospora didyma]